MSSLLSKPILFIVICSLIWAVNACIDVVEISLPEGQKKIVVNGLITDQKVSYQIRISETVGFGDTIAYPPISGAKVKVLDGAGNEFEFAESGETGIYYSDTSTFTGQVGQSYTLFFETKSGDQYRSNTDIMPVLSSMDQLSVLPLLDEDNVNIDPSANNLYIQGFINDNGETDDYYRWLIYENGVLRLKSNEFVLFNDEFHNGNRFRFDAKNVLFHPDNTILLRHVSLSESAYKYYELLRQQSQNNILGTHAIPAIVTGNIQNINDDKEIVLGFFGASSTTVFEIQ